MKMREMIIKPPHRRRPELLSQYPVPSAQKGSTLEDKMDLKKALEALDSDRLEAESPSQFPPDKPQPKHKGCSKLGAWLGQKVG